MKKAKDLEEDIEESKNTFESPDEIAGSDVVKMKDKVPTKKKGAKESKGSGS